MLELSPAGRIGTPDEVGTVDALLMGPDGGFITGSTVPTALPDSITEADVAENMYR